MSHRYSLRKRRGRESGGQQPKRFRQQAIDEPVLMTTKITDVNNDCLEQIFLFLSLEDLLNIAHTNKQLKSAADLTFARKFGGKKSLFVTSSHFYLTVGINRGYEVQNPFRLLRCFGHLIPKQMISHSKMLPYVKVLSYVNQYCYDSTTEIEFFFMFNDDFNGLEKPFVNAETVCFNFCHLNEKLSQLSILFPNVRSLALFESAAKPHHTEAYFSQLEQLDISGPIPAEYSKSAVNVLQLNPQLRRLTLYGDYTRKFVQVASQRLYLLECLDITCSNKDFTDFGDEVVRFPCLKRLSICCEDELTTNIPIESGCLKEFTWKFKYGNFGNVIDFLKKHSSIRKFTITAWYKNASESNEDTVMKIINTLPLLEEVQLLGFKTSVNVANRFMTNCKSLGKLCFIVDNNGEFEQFKENLGREWEASYQHRMVTVAKRAT